MPLKTYTREELSYWGTSELVEHIMELQNRLKTPQHGAVVIEEIRSRAGECLAINDRRVAGIKPYGGGVVTKKWVVERVEIDKALEK